MNGPRRHTRPDPAPREPGDHAVAAPGTPVPGTRQDRDHDRGGWSALIGRARELLPDQGRLAVHGPWGSGKTTVLDELARAAEGRCLRTHAQDGDQHRPYATLVQLLDGVDPDSAREARALTRTDARRVTARLLARGGPGLLLIDDAQWVDAATADVLAHCVRALPPGRLRVVAAERTAAYPRAAARLLGGHPAVVPLAPADAEETAELLHQQGLPVRWAAPVHRLCGGHRSLLAACCRALSTAGGGHSSAGGHLPGIPREVTELASVWLHTLPAGVRATVRAAALAHHPDTDLLRQAGHAEAEDHLDHAVRAGVLAPARPEEHAAGTLPVPVRFTAEALSLAAARTATAGARRRAHAAFARAARDPLQRARHRALAQDGTDRSTAEDTAEAATTAHEAGERGLAAELLLLAARLTPADRPAPRLEHLTRAAREAAAAGRADLTRHAATLIARERGSDAQRVHSLLAVIDAQGQDLSDAEPLLDAARTAAAGEPALLAATELRAAVQANITTGDTARALRHATEAAALAHQGGDTTLQAAALAMTARMQRVLGQVRAAPATLSAALALAVPPTRIGIRNSPEYVAARHAVFDGRLEEAHRALMDLLPAARASGEPEDLVDLWRSLAEVDAGLGSCAHAVDWASDALALTASAGLSPGPAHYTAALAQSHGGSFARALRHAEQGLRASREESDTLHTTRSLWILGAVHLHRGHTDLAATALAEVAVLEGRQGAADPSVLRWQADAAEALAATGRTTAAHALLDRAHRHLDDTTADAALRAALSRARAVCLDQDGHADEAVGLLDEAAQVFAALGRAVEEGRTRLAQGRMERRRRRAAAARTAWQAARTAFAGAGARPWLTLTEHHLAHLAGHPAAATAADDRPADALTGNELRLASLICAGATNREAAQQMFVSPKTVEATLSRIYRKLRVRNRTQLTSTLAPLLTEDGPPGAAPLQDHGAAPG